MNKNEIMSELLEHGGRVYQEVYPCGIDAITVTWIEFDEDPGRYNKYIAIINGELVGYGDSKDNMELSLSLTG